MSSSKSLKQAEQDFWDEQQKPNSKTGFHLPVWLTLRKALHEAEILAAAIEDNSIDKNEEIPVQLLDYYIRNLTRIKDKLMRATYHAKRHAP